METTPPTRDAVNDADIFSVSPVMSFFSWLICEHPTLWRNIGRLESALLAEDIRDVPVKAPIWVTGLARAGSTLLLEKLAALPGVVSQTYQDFPPVFTPYAWNRLLQLAGNREARPVERAHRDRMLITPASPEAMEEPLWMSFFPTAHEPEVSQVIQPGDNSAFADFLDKHIRKLLRVRGGSRYLAKANYQVTRMEYLLDLYPDARFVVPVRNPVMHIASLIKQHRLFSRGQRANPRARAHLRRVGHFEFGLDRRPVNTGDTARTREVLAHWQNGREIEGWALYWALTYGYIADRLTASKPLAAATHLVSYEKLCAEPVAHLQKIFSHCQLAADEQTVAAAASDIAPPDYYQPEFTAAERAAIESLTTPVTENLQRLLPE